MDVINKNYPAEDRATKIISNDQRTTNKDCRIVIKDLFLNLGSWRKEREENQRRLDDLLSDYINKGMNDLIEEVSDLQFKLSVMTKQRNDLKICVKESYVFKINLKLKWKRI